MCIRDSIWTLTSHLKAGEFNLLYHEIAFGRNGLFPPLEIELSDGSKVFLEGRIDRVDILQGDGEDYVKIIDYKSGGIDLDVYKRQLYLLSQNNIPSRRRGT